MQSAYMSSDRGMNQQHRDEQRRREGGREKEGKREGRREGEIEYDSSIKNDEILLSKENQAERGQHRKTSAECSLSIRKLKRPHPAAP